MSLEDLKNRYRRGKTVMDSQLWADLDKLIAVAEAAHYMLELFEQKIGEEYNSAIVLREALAALEKD